MIESLPPEVFIRILKTAAHLELQRRFDGILPSVILTCSKVSRQWRSIVLQAPILFTDICIPFGFPWKAPDDIEKWTRFWLKQSAAALITIDISLPFPSQIPGDDFFSSRVLSSLLNNHIVPNISRLKKFHLISFGGAPPSSVFALLSPLTIVDAPMLQELVIRFDVMPAERLDFTSPPLSPTFQSTPNLRHLVLHGSKTFPPLQERLRELDINFVSVSDASLRQLVLDCPNLEALALRSIQITEPSPFDSKDPIPMPLLRSLVVDFIRGHSVVDNNPHKKALARLLAPNLEYLEVSISALPIDLCNVLPDPTLLHNLRKIKLSGISKTISRHQRVSRVQSDNDNWRWFQQLPESTPLEEVHLTYTSCDILGIEFPLNDPVEKLHTGDDFTLGHLQAAPFAVPDSGPISKELYQIGKKTNFGWVPLVDCRRSSSSALPGGPFKHLKSITIETIAAQDMVWLCQLVSSRAHVQTVCLSKSALSTLRASLVLVEDPLSGGWLLKIRKPGYMEYRLDHVEEKGIDVEQWMRDRVELRIFATTRKSPR